VWSKTWNPTAHCGGPGSLCPRCLWARDASAGSTASSESRAKPVACLALEGDPPPSQGAVKAYAAARGKTAVPPPPRPGGCRQEGVQAGLQSLCVMGLEGASTSPSTAGGGVGRTAAQSAHRQSWTRMDSDAGLGLGWRRSADGLGARRIARAHTPSTSRTTPQPPTCPRKAASAGAAARLDPVRWEGPRGHQARLPPTGPSQQRQRHICIHT
jgi:hypothetical protein